MEMLSLCGRAGSSISFGSRSFVSPSPHLHRFSRITAVPHKSPSTHKLLPLRGNHGREYDGLYGVTGIFSRNFSNSKKIPTPSSSTDKKPPLPQEQVSNRQIISSLAKYLWPKDQPALKARVVVAVALLVGSKVLSRSIITPDASISRDSNVDGANH